MEKFEGFVVFVPLNVGSKSEHFGPVLVNGKNVIELFKKSDNPFVADSFIPFHKLYCKITGVINNDKDRIEVESIEQASDPIVELWEEVKRQKGDDIAISSKEVNNE